MPFTYCEILPGNIAMKNAAVIQPTWRRYCREARAMPSAISTTPDERTTKSAEKGTHVGTCAWNSVRLVVRCVIPAYISAAPRST